MPRKPRPPVTIEVPQVNDIAIREDLDAANALDRRLSRIDEEFGDGHLYDRNRVISECRFYVEQTGRALYEIGRRVLLLKEHEPHGEFLDALHAIGIEPRFAQRAMQAAVKLNKPNAATSPLLALGQSKVIELLVLDDQELEALAEGGTVADLTLDDVDRMTVRELRESLRREREGRAEDQEVSERLLADKNKKIDELDAALHRRDIPEEDAAWDEAAKAVWGAAMGFLGAQEELRAAFRAIDETSQQHGTVPSSVYHVQCQALVWLMLQLEEIRRDFFIADVNLQEIPTAPWEQAADAHAEHVSEVRREAAQKSVAARRAKRAAAPAEDPAGA